MSTQIYITLLLVMFFISCVSNESKERAPFKTIDTTVLKALGLAENHQFTINPFLDISLKVDFSKIVSSREVFFRQSFMKVNSHPVESSLPQYYKHINGFIPKSSVRVMAPAQIAGSGAATIYIGNKLSAVNDIGHWVIAGSDKNNFTKLKLLDKTKGDVVVQLFKPLELIPLHSVNLPSSGGASYVKVKDSSAGGLTVDIYNSKLRSSFHVKGDTIIEIIE